jgi:hypothetical protein
MEPDIGAYIYDNSIYIQQYNILIKLCNNKIMLKRPKGAAEGVFVTNGKKVNLSHSILDYCVNLMRLDRMQHKIYNGIISAGLTDEKIEN